MWRSTVNYMMQFSIQFIRKFFDSIEFCRRMLLHADAYSHAVRTSAKIL